MPATTTKTNEAGIQDANFFDWDSQGVATSGVVRAAPGCVMECWGVNNSGSTRYIQFFDSATVPADTAVPVFAPIAVPTGSSFSLRIGDHGHVFATGIAWASSSTLATKTITGAADVWLTVIIR